MSSIKIKSVTCTAAARNALLITVTSASNIVFTKIFNSRDDECNKDLTKLKRCEGRDKTITLDSGYIRETPKEQKEVVIIEKMINRTIEKSTTTTKIKKGVLKKKK